MTNTIKQIDEWKPICGYEDKYLISSVGRVKTIETGIIRKQQINPNGYFSVTLYNNGKKTTRYTHRLMAVSILGATNKDFANHIDGNKKNNILLNLELVTKRENTTHGIKKGLVGAYKIKSTGRWQSQIHHNKEKIYLGVYNTELEAHKAYLSYMHKHNIKNKYATVLMNNALDDLIGGE